MGALPPTLAALEGELADCLARLEELDRAQALHLAAAAAAATACYWAVAEGVAVAELLDSARRHCAGRALKEVACGVAPRATADSRQSPLPTGRAAAAAFRERAFFSEADADALLRHFVWLLARLAAMLGSIDEACRRVERGLASHS